MCPAVGRECGQAVILESPLFPFSVQAGTCSVVLQAYVLSSLEPVIFEKQIILFRDLLS